MADFGRGIPDFGKATSGLAAEINLSFACRPSQTQADPYPKSQIRNPAPVILPDFPQVPQGFKL